MRIFQLVILFVLCFLGLSGCAHDQRAPFMSGGDAMNQLPMYGQDKGLVKTPEMIAADQNYIEEIRASGYTRETGSQNAASLGWTYLAKGDQARAMSLFNQAWLLNPENGDAYHGFAAVSAERKKPEAEVAHWFTLALSKPGVGVGAYVDYGRYLWMQKHDEAALAMLHQALNVNAKAPNAKRHIAGIYAEMKNYPEACKWGKAAIENGDQDIPQNTVDEFCRQ